MAEGLLRSASIQTVALVGSYVPGQCGIATFTKALRDAVAAETGERQASVVAIDDNAAGYDYPDEVRFQIPQHKQVEYVSAADLLNVNQIDCVLLQHEYGIYGGKDGSHVLEFARTLRMPIISTLHTVLAEPSVGQRAVLKELARLSDRVVVMSHLARKMLHEIYCVPEEKTVYIPHGIPDVPFVDPSFYKEQFGVADRRVLLTFGLLSPGKGIEVAIRAMPRIVEKHPDVMYIILGATHPHVLKSDGNAYRSSLERLVDQLGLDNHVVFHNRFVTLEELLGYIGVAEIYVTPYPNRNQITSGTLAYAGGAGKVVGSTPYWHAEELLAEGLGRGVSCLGSQAPAAQVVALMHYDLTKDDAALALADSYLSFIHHAFNPEQKRFRNFMSYDRRWLEEIGSEDVHGRTVWALGSAVMLAPNDAILSLSIRMFHEAIEVLETFTSPRAWAFALIGLHAYLTRFGGDTPARRIPALLAARLLAQFKANAAAGGPWWQARLTYDNPQ